MGRNWEPLTALLKKLGLVCTRTVKSDSNLRLKSVPDESVLVGLPKLLVDRHPWIKVHLSQVPHLGLLEVSQGVAPKSRWDYCLEQCRILRQIKQTKPGLGLSNGLPELVEAGLNKSTTSALAVLQLWVILTNLGHLFGTFATERALLFSLIHSNPEFGMELIENVPFPLRNRAKTLLDRQFMYQFYEVIACWRLESDPYSDEERRQCIACMGLLDDRTISSKISTLKAIFKFVRRLSYLKLHVELGVTSLLDKHLFSDGVIDYVIEHEELHYDTEVQIETPTEKLLKSIDEYQYETFFAGERTASIVLEHLREFKQWWANQEAEGMPLVNRVQALYRKPVDWPTLGEPQRLNFFVRLELPKRDVATVTGIAGWWQGGDPWGTSNFYISQGPASTHSHVDIFVAKGIKPRTATHIAEQLMAELRRTDLSPNERIRLDRSISRYAISLIGEILLEKYRLRVRRVITGNGQPSLTVLAQPACVNDFCQNLGSLRDDMEDEQRAEEIGGMMEYLKSREFASSADFPVGSLMFAFIGSTFIIQEGPLGGGKSPAKKKSSFFEKEIDGIVGFISRSEIVWHVIEVKSRKKNHPERQSNGVRDFFIPSASQVASMSANGFHMAAFRVAWRG